ncbi:glycosyltransferase BC10 [Gossypium hirsutum]|uniref:Glycosyltransferase BC10 n=1 Tax=Gossypium hirsutum TaxID=3635 RepID=A0ABM2ZI25_GOSHI|nr:glycosyltransferase BC10-like [Gossypium hirsutum]
MKVAKEWRLGSMGDTKILPGSRHRSPLKRPIWIILMVSFVSLFLVCAYIYPPNSDVACYVFSSRGCKVLTDWLPPPKRELTDEEIISRVVVRDILDTPPVESKNPKIAFMFLTPGSLPFEKLWDMFFRVGHFTSFCVQELPNMNESHMYFILVKNISFVDCQCKYVNVYGEERNSNNFGNEGRFSVYIHASKEKPVHVSPYFLNREIHSSPVTWGAFSMVDAERRLLAYALKDLDNQHFVLLSDSCIPLHNFDYVYNYLMHANMSFIDCFVDPGPHGNGRYSTRMLPEVEEKDFRKGAQWFTMRRQHALLVMADSLYYSRFRDYCRPFADGKNCIADEHYLPTFFNLVDPGGIANWSVTRVDWSERKWHPKSYRA